MAVLFFIILFVFVLLLLFIVQINLPRIKGGFGEARVSRLLKKLDNNEYKVFNNVLIKIKNGTSQIDHIVISIYGIYVIETKNYSGWIFGNENSEHWTQIIYKAKTKFRNPVKQNWAHIYALKEAFPELKHAAYYPIVAFAGGGELKNIVSKIPVIYDYEIIKSITEKTEIQNLTVEQVDNMCEKLNKINIRDKTVIKKHINNVENNIYERIQKENSLICPRCGGKLVIREGPYSTFYGCSNYPKCRYTLNH
jgi:DNA-directed RNA polymerase subunit RPC12/RpoP